MDIKTPEQIADERFAANYEPQDGQTMSEVVDYLAASGGLGYDGIRAMIIAAVEADRAQRVREYRAEGWDNAIAYEIYGCLRDRETDESERAAEWVRENENDLLWDEYVGPMLDKLEDNEGAER